MTKAKLPIKTKIAVWWVFVVGIIATIVLISAVPAFTDWSYPIDTLLYLIPVVTGLLFISPSILLCFKTRLVWISSIVILSVEVLLGVTATGYVTLECSTPCFDLLLPPICYLLTLLIPFILIILDRKNYFEMVRQRELETKDSERKA